MSRLTDSQSIGETFLERVGPLAGPHSVGSLLSELLTSDTGDGWLPLLTFDRLGGLLRLVVQRRIVAESRLLQRRDGDALDERRARLAELPTATPDRQLWIGFGR